MFETMESDLWIFNPATGFHPKESERQNPQAIRYQKHEETHSFVIDPNLIEGPLMFLYQFHFDEAATTENPNAIQVKTHITIQPGKALTFIECYEHQSDCQTKVNTQLEITLAANASVNHSQISRGSPSKDSSTKVSPYQYQTSHMKVIQQANSHYQASCFAFAVSYLGTVEVHLMEEKASTEFYSLLPLKHQQKNKLHLTLHHASADCNSKIQVRGLVNDTAQGEFSGKIIVHPEACQTRANLENKNLLLSEQAEMITRPLLEVYNDDIQCSHGATVGQLDQEAIFYLKSRGIPEPTAKKMLIQAFIQPIIDPVPAVIQPLLEACLHEF